jgi:hypothetical protein
MTMSLPLRRSDFEAAVGLLEVHLFEGPEESHADVREHDVHAAERREDAVPELEDSPAVADVQHRQEVFPSPLAQLAP